MSPIRAAVPTDSMSPGLDLARVDLGDALAALSDAGFTGVEREGSRSAPSSMLRRRCCSTRSDAGGTGPSIAGRSRLSVSLIVFVRCISAPAPVSGMGAFQRPDQVI